MNRSEYELQLAARMKKPQLDVAWCRWRMCAVKPQKLISCMENIIIFQILYNPSSVCMLKKQRCKLLYLSSCMVTLVLWLCYQNCVCNFKSMTVCLKQLILFFGSSLGLFHPLSRRFNPPPEVWHGIATTPPQQAFKMWRELSSSKTNTRSHTYPRETNHSHTPYKRQITISSQHFISHLACVPVKAVWLWSFCSHLCAHVGVWVCLQFVFGGESTSIYSLERYLFVFRYHQDSSYLVIHQGYYLLCVSCCFSPSFLQQVATSLCSTCPSPFVTSLRRIAVHQRRPSKPWPRWARASASSFVSSYKRSQLKIWFDSILHRFRFF